MSDSKFVGGMLAYVRGGYQFRVTFKCDERVDKETGITVAVIRGIQVTDQDGRDVNHFIDMAEVANVCYEHASNAIINKT